MSERWFGIDWNTPWRVGDLEVREARFSEAFAIVDELHGQIEGSVGDNRFPAEPMTPTKRRFYDEADLFIFAEGDQDFGFAIGHPSDWSSYYLRWYGVLPSHRGRGLGPGFFARLEAALAEAGVARLETDTHPPNLPSLIQQTRLGFVASGTLAHDRWGSMLRLTKHLSPAADETFRRQFFTGSWSRARLQPFPSRAGKESAR